METPGESELADRYAQGQRVWVRCKKQDDAEWQNVYFFTRLASDEFAKAITNGGGRAYVAGIKGGFDETSTVDA